MVLDARDLTVSSEVVWNCLLVALRVELLTVAKFAICLKTDLFSCMDQHIGRICYFVQMLIVIIIRLTHLQCESLLSWSTRLSSVVCRLSVRHQISKTK